MIGVIKRPGKNPAMLEFSGWQFLLDVVDAAYLEAVRFCDNVTVLMAETPHGRQANVQTPAGTIFGTFILVASDEAGEFTDMTPAQVEHAIATLNQYGEKK